MGSVTSDGTISDELVDQSPDGPPAGYLFKLKPKPVKLFIEQPGGVIAGADKASLPRGQEQQRLIGLLQFQQAGSPPGGKEREIIGIEEKKAVLALIGHPSGEQRMPTIDFLTAQTGARCDRHANRIVKIALLRKRRGHFACHP